MINFRLLFLYTLFIGCSHHSDAQDKSLDERLGELLQSNVYVNNHKILLPCKLADLERAGWWSAEDSLTIELAPSQATDKKGISLVNKANQYLSVRFYNPYPQSVPVKDCYIFGIFTYDLYNTDPEDCLHAPDFEICGLKSKKATPEDLMKTFGTFLAHRQFKGYQNSVEFNPDLYKLDYPFYDESLEDDECNNALYLSISRINDYYPGKLIMMHYIGLGDLLQEEKYVVPYRVK